MRGFSRRLLAVGAAVLVGVTAAPTTAQAHQREVVRQGRILHPVGHLRPGLPARQGPAVRRGRRAHPPQLRLRPGHRGRRLRLGRLVGRLGRAVPGGPQRRRGRRRGRPADRRQPQPARRAQAQEPEAEGADLARRLDRVGVLLGRRPDRRLPQEAGQLLRGPLDQGQPAGPGRGRRRRHLRRHRPRLGVARLRRQRRQRDPARGQAELHPADRRVPQAARRAGPQEPRSTTT